MNAQANKLPRQSRCWLHTPTWRYRMPRLLPPHWCAFGRNPRSAFRIVFYWKSRARRGIYHSARLTAGSASSKGSSEF